MICVGGAPFAAAEGLSHSDKLRVLYSNQFAFDRRGIPLIPIGIIEGADEVVLSASGGLRVLPDGEDGSEVRAGDSWRVRIRSSRPARIAYYAVLDQVSPSALSTLQRAAARWRSRGVVTRLIEGGTIFGIKGRVFDTRALILASGPHARPEGASRQAESFLARGWVAKVRTISQLSERPAATLEARDLSSPATLHVRDALWFAAAGRNAQLSVSGTGAHIRAHGGSQQRRYRGQLYVTVDRTGRLAVVNAVPADQLLAGLVPAEIFPSAPRAALEAQAVAARSDLLSKLGTRHFADPYLICARQHCQVYRGVGHEHSRCTAAVQATRGVVLARKGGGGLINAVYHASSGGFTEDNEAVWPGAPDPALRGHLDGEGRAMAAFHGGITEANISRWLTMVPDSWEARSGVNRDKQRWRVRRDARSLSMRLRALKIGRLKDIQVIARGRSGRANLVRVVGTGGDAQIRGELAIRRAFANLRSSMFVVRRIAGGAGGVEAFEFLGGGWGHGVGMCQSGAIGMAKGGKDFRSILKHYYQASELRRVY